MLHLMHDVSTGSESIALVKLFCLIVQSSSVDPINSATSHEWLNTAAQHLCMQQQLCSPALSWHMFFEVLLTMELGKKVGVFETIYTKLLFDLARTADEN
jgi:hypothetical protein